jgi:bacterial/archaeal transporter family protein
MPTWIFPAIMCAVSYGLFSFFAKMSTPYIDRYSAIVYQAVGWSLGALVLFFCLGGRLSVAARGIGLSLLTGIASMVGAAFFIWAANKGPISIVSTVSALYPVVAIILAALFLREVISARQAVGIGLAILSIFLLTAK